MTNTMLTYKQADNASVLLELPEKKMAKPSSVENNTERNTEKERPHWSKRRGLRDNRGEKDEGNRVFKDNKVSSIKEDTKSEGGEDKSDDKKEKFYINNLGHAELFKIAEKAGIYNYGGTRQELRSKLYKLYLNSGFTVVIEGVVEVLNEFAFVRFADSNYLASPDDIYISHGQVRKLGIKTGDTIMAEISPPRKDEKYFALSRALKINEEEVTSPNSNIKRYIHFDSLTPIYPDKRLTLECESLNKNYYNKNDISARTVDIVAPLGMGQRCLIVAPPKTGKTILMQNIAHSIAINYPDIYLIVLLIDERPEEVTEMQRCVKGEVVSSTFDEPASRHVQLAELVIEKAKRLVERGKNVVILLDNITRLARAYNSAMPSSGKVLTGGVDSNALQRPKRFFGAARNIENGGSLTIIATALIETGSRADEVIFEEFKGTGNCEIVLDRKLADKRVFPALDITKSGTRREELLLDKDTLNKIWLLRRILSPMGPIDAMEFLQPKLASKKNNSEFFVSMTTTEKSTNQVN